MNNNEYQQLGVVFLLVAIFAGFVTFSLNEGMKKVKLKQELKEMKIKEHNLISEIDSLNLLYENFYAIEEYNVTVTGYHPVEEQCDDTPNETADGTKFDISRAGEYGWVAISRDLLKRWGGSIDYGDYIYLSGTETKDGIYQVRDTMNKRHQNWVDILLTPGDDGLFVYKNITMYKIVPYFDLKSVASNEMVGEKI